MPEVICNTSPIQYLFQAGLLEIPPRLYGKIVIPQAVASELSCGRNSGVALPEFARLPWLEVRPVAHRLLLVLPGDLDAGELEVLTLAKQSLDSLAIIDDGLARRYARLFGRDQMALALVLLLELLVGWSAQVDIFSSKMTKTAPHSRSKTETIPLDPDSDAEDANDAHYVMRDNDGNKIKINGKNILIPAIKNSFVIEGNGVLWQQETVDANHPRVVEYIRATSKLIERNKEYLIIECGFSTEDGKSTPTR
jgi:uncharacterized protein